MEILDIMMIWRGVLEERKIFLTKTVFVVVVVVLLKESLKSHHKQNSFCPVATEYQEKGVMLI